MIDLRRLLSRLTFAIREEVPDAAYLAKALDLDISRSRITDARTVMTIRNAILDGNIEIDAAWGRPPHREICLVIAHSSLPYSKIKDETFGANQRIVPSRYSAGFGVVFEIDGWECGYTADSPDGDVGFVFCRKPKALGVRNRPQAGGAGMTISNLDGGVIKPD
ncbi:MAG: hypothetical protein WDN02_09355 [Methylovirgula sp.]|uniref:hypothetical protein n=1 Tax=Methylovirgula sp. TaxID=1978224 RepID=UPI0030761EDE